MLAKENKYRSQLVEKLDLTIKCHANRVALVDDSATLTFGQLSHKIDLLAAALKNKTNAGDHVAVCMPRGIDYIVAVYAIWKIHAVYIPIDDNWPKQRRDQVIAQSGAKVVIGSGLQLNSVNTDVPQASEEDTAYIIFTSGTTGQPKGVVIGHRALDNLVSCHQKEIYLPSNVLHGPVAMNASFCFDSAIERISLVAQGYTLYVISDAVRKSPLDLVAYINAHAIKNIDLVPSHLQLLLKTDLLSSLSLRLVIVGGEAIGQELWEQLAQADLHFFNVYGPTENTINTSLCKITAGVPTIGQPLDGVGVFIVKENGDLCFDGEMGELFVFGTNLAHGYLNNPEQNHRAFVAFEGHRCYRTGDIVKYNSDGNLVFCGRIDDQVKVSGYRIEIDEIKREILKQNDVKSVAITPQKHPNGTTLLASLVLNVSEAPHQRLEELKHGLKAVLPHYMVPLDWQVLEALPLTENLKLDHKKLLAMWNDNRNAGHMNVAEDHDDPCLIMVTRVWEEVLDKSDVSGDDHFFALGDSLAAMSLLVAVEREMGIKLNLTDIFKYPTVNRMSAYIRTAMEKPVA